MPFNVADVNNIEMYRNVVPNSAEKQVITETVDIADIYFLFSGLKVSDKKTEPVAGGTVTSFRYSFRDDTLIMAFVKNGLGVTISQKLVMKGVRRLQFQFLKN